MCKNNIIILSALCLLVFNQIAGQQKIHSHNDYNIILTHCIVSFKVKKNSSIKNEKSFSNLSISCFHFLFHKAKYIESFEQPNIYFYLPKFKILKNHIVKKNKWDESLLRRSQTN